ncbi:MAG: DUF1924 domain-containing protein [Oricola sp.]
MIHPHTLFLAAAALALVAVPAGAGPRDDILAGYAAQAGVKTFDPAAGEAFFRATHSGGNPDTPTCTACHSDDPKNAGRTSVGKPIDPMAVSANPERFTDPAKVEKWFTRNCSTVLGRECTPMEKGDVIAWLSSL